MMLSRRRALGGGVAALILAATPISGCALLQNDPVPLVPFTDFVVRETGGVDGRDLPLVVFADGTALMLGRDEPAGGQLDAERMARLKTLLESEDLRREAANPPKDRARQRCSDIIGVSIEMGTLTLGRDQTCGGIMDRSPAYDKILALVADAREDSFDAPLSPATPALPSIRLDRTGAEDDPDVTVTIQADGSARIASRDGGAGVPREQSLEPEQRDALRMALSKDLDPHVHTRTCGDVPTRYVLRVGDEKPVKVKACAGPVSTRIVINAIEQAFDL